MNIVKKNKKTFYGFNLSSLIPACRQVRSHLSPRKGQTLIELVLIMGIMAIILPALLTGFVASRSGKPQAVARERAVEFLKESEAAVRNIKNTNWGALSVNGSFHTEISGSQWTLVSDPITNSDGITQELVISDVYRDTNTGAIVETGGTVDPSTKKVDINISWVKPRSTSINSVLYLTRTTNETFTESSQDDFNGGVSTNVSVEATGGSSTDGHIQLETTGEEGEGGGGGGSLANWCEPDLSITALDLPKNGVANAISAIEGRVFAGTGNNSSGVSFANVNITNTNPPESSIHGTFDGYKTNDVFGEANYAYLATDTNSKEIVIVDLSSSPYVESGYFNAPGNGNGKSVFVSNNIGYVASGNKLYTFDLTSKSGSRPQLGSITLDGIANSIFVRDNYVYVALGIVGYQIEIVQVSNNGTTLNKTSSKLLLDLEAKDVWVNQDGTRAYLATVGTLLLKDLFILDITNKSDPQVVGRYESNGMNPKGITVIPEHNKVILVGSGGEEYQVIDVSNEAEPVRCGGLNIDTGVNGISSVFESDGDAYSYIITGDASAELKIIEGGPGGAVNNANWCSPETAIINSTSLSRTGNVIYAKNNKAFIGSGDGTSGVEYTDLNVTNPPPPSLPSSSIKGTLSGTLKVNSVFSDGNYAFLAIDGSATQVRILDTRTSPFSEIGQITLGSNSNANGVYVKDDIAYVTSNNKLYTYDVSTKTGNNSSPLTSIDLYAQESETPVARQVEVVGNKAFVSSSSTIYGLQVFLVGSGGSTLRLVGVSDLSFTHNPSGLSVNDTRTRSYVSYSSGTGSVQKGYFAIDTSEIDPPDWWPIPNFYPQVANYNSQDTTPSGIDLVANANNRVILTGNGGEYQYHVVDISLDTDPIRCGGLSIAEGINGVVSVKDSFDRGFSFIITGQSSNQFKIIQGGSGGGNFREDGSFVSKIFESTTSASFNRFAANVIKPDAATIRMQVASAEKVNNSCNLASYSYVGPDGSATSFFNPVGSSITAPIPFGSQSASFRNPSACFRYKTWFTTWDTSVSPVFEDISVNYSP